MRSFYSLSRDDKCSLLTRAGIAIPDSFRAGLTRQGTTTMYTCGVRQNLNLTGNRKRRTIHTSDAVIPAALKVVFCRGEMEGSPLYDII
jgi:hypothetical protein